MQMQVLMQQAGAVAQKMPSGGLQEQAVQSKPVLSGESEQLHRSSILPPILPFLWILGLIQDDFTGDKTIDESF